MEPTDPPPDPVTPLEDAPTPSLPDRPRTAERTPGGASDATPTRDGPPTQRDLRQVVKRYLKRLQASPNEAAAAYRELCRAPEELIPLLIEEVNNPQITSLRQLDVVVLKKWGDIVRRDEATGRHFYFVPGMGRLSFDDISLGQARGVSGGLRVRYRNYRAGFPAGVVLRAALLNRFRSRDFPRYEDTDIRSWWRSFYLKVRGQL